MVTGSDGDNLRDINLGRKMVTEADLGKGCHSFLHSLASRKVPTLLQKMKELRQEKELLKSIIRMSSSPLTALQVWLLKLRSFSPFVNSVLGLTLSRSNTVKDQPMK